MFPALLLLVLGCAGPVMRAEHLSREGRWMEAVLEYRRAVARHPKDAELRSQMRQTELLAAEAFHQYGLDMQAQGRLDEAVLQYRQGLVAMPENDKLARDLAEALAAKEAETYYEEGLRLASQDRKDEARASFLKALEAKPGHEGAKSALGRLPEAGPKAGGLVLGSKAPITLNFKGTGLRTAFEYIAKSFGINVLFDDGIKDDQVTIFAQDVTFDQALNLLLTTSQTFYKQIGANTILIAPDTKAARDQYEDLLVRTFHLNSAKAADMLTILRGVLNLRRVTVNEAMNALIIRDSRDMLDLAAKVIAANDRIPAEVLLEVEILEVNRTKAEQLGLNYGSRVLASIPEPSLGSLETAKIRDIIAGGTLTLPALVFNFFKQDVDAKTLANPKVRVLDGSQAKIHIGDRVPLRSSTIQDATGQIRFTFEYREIGIRLDALPQVHPDRTVGVTVSLEVSTLGANLGTESEPAYSIGTRNADTSMILKDGETAILGGLIRDEDRRNRVRVPILGDIPVVGRLFTTAKDDSKGRTDILLTITPRIVRASDLPGSDLREFYSGTENTASTKPLFSALEEPAEGKAGAKVLVDEKGAGESEVAPAAAPGQVLLTFSQATFEAALGEDVEVGVLGQNLGGLPEITLGLAYNPAILGQVSAQAGPASASQLVQDLDPARGLLKLTLKPDAKAAAAEGPQELARLRLRALKTGLSYLVFLTPSFKDKDGKDIHAQARASRVVVR